MGRESFPTLLYCGEAVQALSSLLPLLSSTSNEAPEDNAFESKLGRLKREARYVEHLASYMDERCPLRPEGSRLGMRTKRAPYRLL